MARNPFMTFFRTIFRVRILLRRCQYRLRDERGRSIVSSHVLYTRTSESLPVLVDKNRDTLEFAFVHATTSSARPRYCDQYNRVHRLLDYKNLRYSITIVSAGRAFVIGSVEGTGQSAGTGGNTNYDTGIGSVIKSRRPNELVFRFGSGNTSTSV